MTELTATLFYGFRLWDESITPKRDSEDEDSDEYMDEEAGGKKCPEWFEEYTGKLGKINDDFEKALKESKLQIVEYRQDGATYSDSEYFLAVEDSVIGGEEPVCHLGQKLPKPNPGWVKILKKFCQEQGKKFDIAFKKPEFIVCVYSAE